MYTLKKFIIFILFLSLIIPYGCVSTPPVGPQIPSVPYYDVQEESPQKKLGMTRMRFRLSQGHGQEQSEDLDNVISTCALENGVSLSSHEEVNAANSVASGKFVQGVGSVGFFPERPSGSNDRIAWTHR